MLEAIVRDETLEHVAEEAPRRIDDFSNERLVDFVDIDQVR